MTWENRQAAELKSTGIGTAKLVSIEWDPNRRRETIAQAPVNVFPQFLGMPVLSAEQVQVARKCAGKASESRHNLARIISQ